MMMRCCLSPVMNRSPTMTWPMAFLLILALRLICWLLLLRALPLCLSSHHFALGCSSRSLAIVNFSSDYSDGNSMDEKMHESNTEALMGMHYDETHQRATDSGVSELGKVSNKFVILECAGYKIGNVGIVNFGSHGRWNAGERSKNNGFRLSAKMWAKVVGDSVIALLETARKANFKDISSRIATGFSSGRWDRPTLLAWGISDKYLPQSEAEEFQKGNPTIVKLKLIEGAGHMPQEDWLFDVGGGEIAVEVKRGINPEITVVTNGEEGDRHSGRDKSVITRHAGPFFMVGVEERVCIGQVWVANPNMGERLTSTFANASGMACADAVTGSDDDTAGDSALIAD
ncbi:hypothetical protein IFM89_003685 [Coptis chinensis]|uniref:Uncharacterized protein n=1 Tax=Coptis chinensis TaxID=261450 RepID=A0A835IY19_9MAGN|nr:hypothetical protein IFM89_003685 [Coptis chinensis]